MCFNVCHWGSSRFYASMQAPDMLYLKQNQSTDSRYVEALLFQEVLSPCLVHCCELFDSDVLRLLQRMRLTSIACRGPSAGTV